MKKIPEEDQQRRRSRAALASYYEVVASAAMRRPPSSDMGRADPPRSACLSEILAPAEDPAESCTDISILHDMSRVNSESACSRHVCEGRGARGVLG